MTRHFIKAYTDGRYTDRQCIWNDKLYINQITDIDRYGQGSGENNGYNAEQ
jgi:hypothetical protein